MEVILLEEMLEDIEVTTVSGSYVKGDYISEDSVKEIKAICFPIDQRTMSLLPQGAVTKDSIKLYSKEPLENISEVYIVRKATNIKYRVYSDKPYITYDSLNVYLLNKDSDN